MHPVFVFTYGRTMLNAELRNFLRKYYNSSAKRTPQFRIQHSSLCILYAVTTNSNSSLPDMYFAGAFHDGIAHDDFAYAVQRDMSGAGIFHGIHMTPDVGLHIRIFKGQVSTFHGAVDQFQILAVAQWLSADDVAVDEGQPF